MAKRPEVITVGSAMRDVFLVSRAFEAFRSKRFNTGIGECVALGSKFDVQTLVLSTGGGASNAAATFASLGCRTAIVCRVGNDTPGRDIIGDLARAGVETRWVKKIQNKQTGYSTLLTMPDGERSALTFRGVSADVTAKDIPWNARPSWIFLSSMGGKISKPAAVIKRATRRGIRLAWNPGRQELEAGLSVLAPLIERVHIFTLNLEEARILAARPNETARELLTLIPVGPNGVVIITDGPRGAYAKIDSTILRVQTTGARSISRTGAGDAFAGGCTAALIKTNDLTFALKVAILNAESVIQKIGAKAGILKLWPSPAALKRVRIAQL